MTNKTPGIKEFIFDKAISPILALLAFVFGIIFTNMGWSVTHIMQNEKDIVALSTTAKNTVNSLERVAAISQTTDNRLRQLEIDVAEIK